MQKGVMVKKQHNSPREARGFLANLPRDPPVHPQVQVYTVPEDDRRVGLRGSLGCRVAEGELIPGINHITEEVVYCRDHKMANTPGNIVVLLLELRLKDRFVFAAHSGQECTRTYQDTSIDISMS